MKYCCTCTKCGGREQTRNQDKTYSTKCTGNVLDFDVMFVLPLLPSLTVRVDVRLVLPVACCAACAVPQDVLERLDFE